MTAPIGLAGIVSVEHTFEVPLDHHDPAGPKIEVFARELADPDGRSRPLLVYLQGGPGFEAPRPTRSPAGPGWLDRALKEFRVLMLDQRGTGRSTPVDQLAGRTAEQQADYLAHFRADSIVRDAEWIRAALGSDPWTVLGQSFGGLCVTSYLSIAPEGLREALITGGLPPLRRHPDDVYDMTYRRVRDRTERYFARYPEDRARVSELRMVLEAEELRLPDGRPLTWRSLRQCGTVLGMSDGAERLHYLLELPRASPAFRHDVQDPLGASRNPIYAILHEACWADGGRTGWSAARMLPAEYETEALFTGEHVFPWMFDEYPELVALRDAAHLLAERDWPHLYDPDVLAGNTVPTAALIYAEDMYVERTFSEETAARIGGLRTWITNEYDHNGLRVDGERILGRLLELARGGV